jgi:hypothetical protein
VEIHIHDAVREGWPTSNHWKTTLYQKYLSRGHVIKYIFFQYSDTNIFHAVIKSVKQKHMDMNLTIQLENMYLI